MLYVETLPFYKWIKPWHRSGKIRETEIKKGAFIDGSSGDPYAMHFILEGGVKVFYISTAGREFLLDEITEGQFAGYLTKVLGHRFQPSLQAATDCRLLYFPHTVFRELLTIPEFAAFFYRKAADRVYFTYQKLLLNNLFSQKEMIAFYLYSHSRNGVYTGTLADLEAELLISRRSLFYIMKQLREEGILIQKNRKYYMADEKKLEDCVRDIRLFKESMQ